LLNEGGLSINHTTIMRWVHRLGPELSKRCRPFLKTTNSSFRCDETYIKVKGKWKYLYRAVDSKGQTLYFLTAKRNHQAAIRFFTKLLGNTNRPQPRVINTDKNPAYPIAIESLKDNEILSQSTRLRKSNYLNNVIEQDHRRIKRYIRHSSWFQSFKTASVTINTYEKMHMIHRVKYVV
jgi:IS6 family transposase